MSFQNRIWKNQFVYSIELALNAQISTRVIAKYNYITLLNYEYAKTI